MLKSRIVIDLPSAETDRRKGPLEWVRSLFGAKLDLRSGREEITVGAFSLVEALVAGFAAAGVTDAISFLVDRKVVYIDTNDVPEDLPLITKAAEAAGILEKPFKEMHLVLAHKSPTLHTLFDCEVTNGVLVGTAEMTITCSSRLNDMQIRTGEGAKEYAERVKAFAARPASFEPARLELDVLTQRITEALGRTLVGAKLTRDAAAVHLVRPDGKQIGRFRKLGFGDKVKAPTYRAVPTTHRSGAYADPFYYYYYDPYYDYMSYMLVSSMIHDSMWHSPHVHVVDPAGHELYTGDHVPSAAAASSDGWSGHDAVNFGANGDLEVNNAVDAEAASSAWSDSPASFADSSSSSDAGSSCSSSSSESSSSCSSSSDTSSSSCGSSCSSTSSCGSSCSSD